MKSFILLLVMIASLSATAQRTHYKMSSSVHCTKTTESGEDEIYILVVWKTSYGQKGTLRLPVTMEHISINDHDRDINAGSTVYPTKFEFDLAPNENIEIFYSIMEQDDGTIAQYEVISNTLVRRRSSFANLSSASYKSIMSSIASNNNLGNSDDWIGAFTYKVSRDAAGTLTDNNPVKLDNTNNGGATSSRANATAKSKTFEFTGDGSHYFVTFSVDTK